MFGQVELCLVKSNVGNIGTAICKEAQTIYSVYHALMVFQGQDLQRDHTQ